MTAHVSHNSGKAEWYTPPDILRAARAVMGGIDLDAASSALADRLVRSGRFLTVDDDALDPNTSWRSDGGRVWLNPPYASRLIGRFADRLLAELQNGTVSQAVWLSNNATETAWGQRILSSGPVVCFPARRIRFLDERLQAARTPLQGQMIVGLGRIRVDVFVQTFGQYGLCRVDPNFPRIFS